VPRIGGIEVDYRMTNVNKRSDLKYPGAVGDGALEPIIQSALGLVRETAGLLYHIAEFGIALVSDPKPSRGAKRTGSAAPKGANVIPFPQLETSSRRPKLNRNKS
jgi:hypothetical protein